MKKIFIITILMMVTVLGYSFQTPFSPVTIDGTGAVMNTNSQITFTNTILAVGNITVTNNSIGGSPSGVSLTTNGSVYATGTVYMGTLAPVSGTGYSVSGTENISAGSTISINSGAILKFNGGTINGALPSTSGFSVTNIQSSNVVQNAIINYQNFNTWDPNAGGSHVTPTACPNAGDAHGAIRGYQINAGSTYAQGWCWQNGDYFGTKTNFQLIAEVWVTNTYTITNMSFTESFIDKQGRDVFYNNPTYSPSVTANQMNYVTNTFSINPTNAGNIAQITFFAGYGSTPSWLSTWWVSYRLIGY